MIYQSGNQLVIYLRGGTSYTSRTCPRIKHRCRIMCSYWKHDEFAWDPERRFSRGSFSTCGISGHPHRLRRRKTEQYPSSVTLHLGVRHLSWLKNKILPHTFNPKPPRCLLGVHRLLPSEITSSSVSTFFYFCCNSSTVTFPSSLLLMGGR